MIPIAITQRVDVVTHYGERRDCLDQRWAVLCREAGILPVPMPNDPETAMALIEEFPIQGVILTGGNDLAAYGGDAPERDHTEAHMIRYALETKKPLLGVCRGMLAILHYFDIPLQRVENHVRTRHMLSINGQEREVNSYHNYAAKTATRPIEVTARAEDGCIEAVRHTEAPIHGIMWHPERETPASLTDLTVLIPEAG